MISLRSINYVPVFKTSKFKDFVAVRTVRVFVTEKDTAVVIIKVDF